MPRCRDECAEEEWESWSCSVLWNDGNSSTIVRCMQGFCRKECPETSAVSILVVHLLPFHSLARQSDHPRALPVVYGRLQARPSHQGWGLGKSHISPSLKTSTSTAVQSCVCPVNMTPFVHR